MSNKEFYGVFINDEGNLKVEPTDPFESVYYVYTNTKENCEKFVEKYKDKFSNYEEFIAFLKNWCKENNIEYRGCGIKFSESAV